MSVVFLGDIHIDTLTEFGADMYFSTLCNRIGKCRLVVLLGDICDGNPLLERNSVVADFLLRLTSRYNVVAVMGNHDYYDSPLTTETYQTLSNSYKLLGVTVFNNQCISIPDVGTILFSTLWCGLDNVAELHNTQSVISDFKCITDLTVEQIQHQHKNSVQYIKENYHKVDYVVTHFAPSYMSKSGRYQHTHAPHIEQYFYTELFNYGELDCLLDNEKPVLWVHGHTHTRAFYVAGNTTVHSVESMQILKV